MKRRAFIKGVGMSSAALATTRGYGTGGQITGSGLSDFTYGGVESLEDAISQEGLVVIRIAIGDNHKRKGFRLAGRLWVKKAEIDRAKSYFFENDEAFDADLLSFDSVTTGNDKEVLVLWLRDASEKTILQFNGTPGFQLTLEELVEMGEASLMQEGVNITINFLLDREIGEVSLADFGAREPEDEFSFVTMADPQGGFPDDDEKLKTRMKIHNAFIQESVELANGLDCDPIFTVIAGDVCDDWGYEKDLVQMNAFLSKLNTPVLYGIGNHETLLRCRFGPGYNMDAFNNFLAAQQSINGLDKLLYSFNAGQWHFIIWPDPLRTNFWETHPHYFDWLERDLEKHKERHTMVIQHVPSQPTGITPHINYAESVYVRRTYLEILARHGNVRYILSGHVHIPVKASFKTAVSIKGINLINIPAAGYRPRSFGEEDYFGGPSQGIAIVHIRKDKASIQYKTVTEEVFSYPSELPEFDEMSYPLWLKEKWELPADHYFKNSDFSEGFKGWARRYVYHEDVHPSNLCETRNAPERDGSALYLFCRRRGYQAPGQDRLPQDINRISQAVMINNGITPMIRFTYMIDGEHTDPEGYAGGYVLVEGYSGSNRVHKLMYSAGKIWVNNWGDRDMNKDVPYLHFALLDDPDYWHRVNLNIGRDFERTSPGKSYGKLKVDRLVVTLGVWNINDGYEQPFGIYFTGFELDEAREKPSNIDSAPVEAKSEEDVWWLNKIWPWVHAAGEHRYIISTQKD